MILTLFYMYATFVQRWRLNALRNKLNGTLNPQNALLLSTGNTISDPKHKRCLENLLYQKEGRIACTVVPRQKLSLSQWVMFPKDPRCFPIHIGASRGCLQGPKLYLLFQAQLDSYTPYSRELIEVEKYGEPVAWRASEYFEVILKTDLNYLTKLMNSFSYTEMDINHDLKLMKIETVDVEGVPAKIKYDKKFSNSQQLNYSRAPAHWKRFVSTIRNIYSKLNDNLHPKITIENGTKPEEKPKVPISEVKPIKKIVADKPLTTKNTLEVRSHSSRHKKRDLSPQQEQAMVKPIRQNTPLININGTEEKDIKPKEVTIIDPKHSPEKSEVKPLESAINKKENGVEPTNNDTVLKSVESTNGLGAVKREKPVEGDALKKEKSVDKHKSSIKRDKSQEGLKKDKSQESKKEAKRDKSIESKKETKREKSVEAKKETKRDKSLETTKKDVKEVKRDKSLETAKSDTGAIKKDIKPDKKSKEEKVKTVHIKDSKSKKTEMDKNKLTVLKPKKPSEEEQRKGKSYSQAAQSIPPSGKNLQRQNATSSKETSPNRVVKPPNILVYADSVVAKENVKSVLKSIINKEKYTIYDLPVNTSASFWDSSTTLVIVCGSVTQNLTPHLLQYLVSGGQLLCLCSDLLYSVLQTFSTAEVREHELVRFSYGDWKNVKMMHHIFCYQASPAKKQFSKDSDQSNPSSNGSSPVAPRTPSTVDIQHNGQNYTIQVQVLGAEETWQTPSLLLATVKNSAGKAIFSQVHLEVDPSQYQDDESKYSALKDSNMARLEILKHILSTHLDIDCKSFTQTPEYSPAYFLGRHDLKLELLNNCEFIKDSKLEMDEVQLEFCGKGVEPGIPTSSRLPVLILTCPANFSTVSYFETLQTEHVGRLVIYSDILKSSQNLITKKLMHGLAVIARQQTAGRGRSGNDWLSPEGCAMFSLQLHFKIDSPLGQSLPLVQHLVMVAIISTVKSIPGLENIDIGLKWPNDLYAYSSVKIGGLIVTSIIEGDTAVINIGCGINLNNQEPTLCLNEIITRHNAENKTHVELIQMEKFFALTFNEIERILKVVQEGNLTYLFDLYYKYWLHNNARITVSTKDGESREVLVTGIDSYGFLLVQTVDGITSSVQPDGNSFDMLKGLIAPKIS